jgi:hypothetical protein
MAANLHAVGMPLRIDARLVCSLFFWILSQHILLKSISFFFWHYLACLSHRLQMWRFKKKNSCVGATSWYHCVAEFSRIPKMPVIYPLQALVHPQTQKKTILHGLSIPNPNFSEFAFFW